MFAMKACRKAGADSGLARSTRIFTNKGVLVGSSMVLRERGVGAFALVA